MTLAFASGCGPSFSSRVAEYSSFTAETSECLNSIPHENTVALTGTATFQKRGVKLVLESNKLKNMLLGDPLTTALPIKYAEVAVYDQKRILVQCGLTDASGNLKAVDGTSDLLIPSSAQTFLVRVLARTNIPFGGSSVTLNASVKEDIYRNTVHYIEGSVHSDGENVPAITLVAKARQTDSVKIEGGAFNILNNAFHAYQYLATNTAGVDASCLNKRLNIFWKPGFNPYQYLYPNSDPETLDNTSYYSHEDKKLFITGGRVGDVSFENTDHFDDFATIHEIGHFIEESCGQFISAGGSHSLIVRIDPRLAWSEGWSNYFATQVMNAKLNSIDPTLGARLVAAGETAGWTYFFNSSGFNDSVQNIGNAQGVLIDFKNSGTNPGEWQTGPYTGVTFDKVNSILYPGEGHFREGAISRGLFKITNNCGANCVATTPVNFLDIWRSFDRITGIAASQNPFLSSDSFFANLKSRVTWGNYKPTLETEALQIFSDGGYTSAGIHRWIPYGHSLVYSATACSTATHLQPRNDDPLLTGSNSDQRYSNHFYTIDLLSFPAGLNQINVTFNYVAGTATDIDLILFKEMYHFNDDYVCSVPLANNQCAGTWSGQKSTNEFVVKSNRTTATNQNSTYTKSIAGLSTLDPNLPYLLDLRAYTANKSIGTSTEYSYTITSNLGGYLCPQ